MDLLKEYGYIDKNLTLREAYEQTIGIYNLERNSEEMWKMVWNHKIFSLFQMEKQSGINGIDLTKPKNIEDLAHLNSIIRLMAQEKGAETPLEKYSRYKENIKLWYEEMERYGLTEKEIKVREHLEETYKLVGKLNYKELGVRYSTKENNIEKQIEK